MAVTGVAIVPLMLLYLMYGITDALPVLITTVVLVINSIRKRSAMQGVAMMLGNFIGGMVAFACYALLQIAPSFRCWPSLPFSSQSPSQFQLNGRARRRRRPRSLQPSDSFIQPRARSRRCEPGLMDHPPRAVRHRVHLCGWNDEPAVPTAARLDRHD